MRQGPIAPRVFTRPLSAPSTRIFLSDAPRSSTGAATDRKAGAVKWFNTQKGFGFITPADGSADVFVHQTAIYAPGFRSLAEGEAVEYEVRGRATRAPTRVARGLLGWPPLTSCAPPCAFRLARGAPRRLRRARTGVSGHSRSPARTATTSAARRATPTSRTTSSERRHARVSSGLPEDFAWARARGLGASASRAFRAVAGRAQPATGRPEFLAGSSAHASVCGKAGVIAVCAAADRSLALHLVHIAVPRPTTPLPTQRTRHVS